MYEYDTNYILLNMISYNYILTIQRNVMSPVQMERAQVCFVDNLVTEYVKTTLPPFFTHFANCSNIFKERSVRESAPLKRRVCRHTAPPQTRIKAKDQFQQPVVSLLLLQH